MKSPWLKVIAWVLVPALLLCAFPAPCYAATDESGSDSTFKGMTMALFVVLVGVLVWIGYNHDHDRMVSTDEPEGLAAAQTTIIKPILMDARPASIDRPEEPTMSDLASRVGVGLQIPF